jgi:hypothetical protein
VRFRSVLQGLVKGRSAVLLNDVAVGAYDQRRLRLQQEGFTGHDHCPHGEKQDQQKNGIKQQLASAIDDLPGAQQHAG